MVAEDPLDLTADAVWSCKDCSKKVPSLQVKQSHVVTGLEKGRISYQKAYLLYASLFLHKRGSKFILIKGHGESTRLKEQR